MKSSLIFLRDAHAIFRAGQDGGKGGILVGRMYQPKQDRFVLLVQELHNLLKHAAPA